MSSATGSATLTTGSGTLNLPLNPLSQSSSSQNLTEAQKQAKVTQMQSRINNTSTTTTSSVQLTGAPQTQVMEEDCCTVCCGYVRRVCTLENCGQCVLNSALICGTAVVCIVSCLDPQMRQEYWS